MSSIGQPTKMTLYLSRDQVQILYGIARQWLPLEDSQVLEVEMDVLKEDLGDPPELVYLRRETKRLTDENGRLTDENGHLTDENDRLASQVRLFQSILDDLQSEVRAFTHDEAPLTKHRII
jgi:hypothetical protein